MDKNTKIENLYLKHKDHIYNLILRLANDKDLALDVTQQTFLNILANDIQPNITKSWLITVARNIFYSEVKRKNSIPIDNIDESTEYNFINQDFIQLPISKALKNLQIKVEISLAKLSIETKEIMILYFIENLSIITIANISKRSIIDIKVNLHHACILFETRLVKIMKRKILASGAQCPLYARITNKLCYTDIPNSDLKVINLHISNCENCIDTKQQLKVIGILLNLTPIFIIPQVLDKVIRKNLIIQLHYQKETTSYLKLIHH